MAMPERDPVPETPDELLTLTDVAAYLKAGRRTVFYLARQGQIPAFKLDLWIAESIDRKTPEAE